MVGYSHCSRATASAPSLGYEMKKFVLFCSRGQVTTTFLLGVAWLEENEVRHPRVQARKKM